MESRLGVGIIGCGNISATHLKVLSEMSDVKLVAMCDNKPERAQAAAARYGAAAVEDWKSLIQRPDVDVIHVLTPHYLHAEMALEALKAGKFVLCEKPMATRVADARAMIEADPTGLRLGIIFQNRYNQSAVRAKEMLEAGALGRIVTLKASVTWFRDAAYYGDDWHGRWATEGGGSLINQAIHTVDMLYYLGGPFAAIKGSITTDLLQGVIEVEENSHAVIRYQNGAVGLLHTSNSYGISEVPEVVVVCEKGTLCMRGDLLILREEDKETVLVEPETMDNGTKAVYGNGHVAQIPDFYRCIRSGTPYWLNATEAFPAIWAVLSIYRSSECGQWVSFGETVS
ncbi:MAG TPA: Gfo/Idh/MocA family oxidoreductase [Clostridia bacterium]|nr:Gfo/Idh/MocA family oxidoreductase [Clostridia bacterium]